MSILQNVIESIAKISEKNGGSEFFVKKISEYENFRSPKSQNPEKFRNFRTPKIFVLRNFSESENFAKKKIRGANSNRRIPNFSGAENSEISESENSEMSIYYCFVTEKNFDWENNNKWAISQKWQKSTKTSYYTLSILDFWTLFLPFFRQKGQKKHFLRKMLIYRHHLKKSCRFSLFSQFLKFSRF